MLLEFALKRFFFHNFNLVSYVLLAHGADWANQSGFSGSCIGRCGLISGPDVKIVFVLPFNDFSFFLLGKKKSYFPRCSWVTQFVCCALFSVLLMMCGGRHINTLVY